MLDRFLARPNYFPFRKLFWKYWYNSFAYNTFNSNVEIDFMNYGYAELDSEVNLLTTPNFLNQGEHYCLQLYHYVASAIPLEGLDVIEIGCGRGGGTEYIKRCFKPKSMTGVDFARGNIDLCQKKYSVPQLEFYTGDAESLSFEKDAFDVVINIESSHCYGNEELFFREAYRVIRPGGYFLFADFRPQEAISATKEKLKLAGFELVKEQIITDNVVKSLDLDHQRKLQLILEKSPKYIRGMSKWFSANQGTPVYQAFKNKELEYFYYVLQKPAIAVSN